MTTPALSLLVAAYRSNPAYLQTALRSALAQTDVEVEVLVRDDSPDDRLRDVVGGLRDGRLRYRHNARPLGPASNHSALLSEARTEYVSILNHDDWIAPQFGVRLVHALSRQPQAVIAFCDHWVVDARGRRMSIETESNSIRWGRDELTGGLHQPFLHLLGAQSVPMAMGTVIRRSAVPASLPEVAGAAYDLWLTYLLARTGAGAVYVPERHSAWRQHGDNQTSAAGIGWMHGAAACWLAVAEDPGCAPLRSLALRKASLGFYGCAMRSWASGQRVAGLRHGLRSLGARVSARGLAACVLPLLPPGLAPRQWRLAS